MGMNEQDKPNSEPPEGDTASGGPAEPPDTTDDDGTPVENPSG
ncbi:MAG TPA: hypothetical protein VN200_06140 [Rhodoglobus sp.]|nr:hypothetical protein [Rhodoglobus sp.]